MLLQKTDKGYIARLEKGERFMETLVQFAEREGMATGFFYGIGAALEAELGLYILDRKEYQFKHLNGPLEIVSVIGDITQVEGRPFVHAHMSVADESLHMFGGHVKEVTIGATCELFITNVPLAIHRELDHEIGLKLLSL